MGTTKYVERYCVRIQLQAFGSTSVYAFSSIARARDMFAELLYEARNWRDDEACSCVVYRRDPSEYTHGDKWHCDCSGCECTSDMNFHDYPVAMFVLGPRGGIKSEYV